MRVFDQLPQPIVLCIPATTPLALHDVDNVAICAVCGTSIWLPHFWIGHCSLICLTCFLVHAEDVPTC